MLGFTWHLKIKYLNNQLCGMSLFDDIFGETEQQKARRHQRKGRAAEDQVEMELRMEGFDQVEPVHEGADYHAKKHDILTGDVIEEKKVEVKSGRSGLTERQRREKEKSDNYEVRRRDPLFY